MTALKRILAIAGLILMAVLFAALLFLAFTGAPREQLMAIFFAIVFLSVLLYVMRMMARVFEKREED